MDSSVGATSRICADSLSYVARDRKWLEEWREVGISCVHVTVAVWEDARAALTSIGAWRRLARENGDLVEIAATPDAIAEIVRRDRTAIILGFQNSAPIEHDLELVETFRTLGVLVMQLTYNLQNYIGSGYWEASDTGVSSRFGRNVIEEMNRVGMLIDLSHCGDQTTLDAIETSSRPVAVTHANPREYVEAPPFGAGRLTTTEALKALSRRGGYVGLSPLESIALPADRATLADFVDMISWTADRIGIEAIGIGSDYCPGHPADITTWWRYSSWSRERAPDSPKRSEMEYFPDWFRAATRYQALGDALSERGFSESEISGVLGGNFLRVLKKATGSHESA